MTRTDSSGVLSVLVLTMCPEDSGTGPERDNNDERGEFVHRPSVVRPSGRFEIETKMTKSPLWKQDPLSDRARNLGVSLSYLRRSLGWLEQSWRVSVAGNESRTPEGGS